ncbi:MAG: hypothetical protein BGO98_31860 [Myxococcales bacterium 68-20]|nr:MAG: hypothetical protein BGO98_31860 [Myxococcales bacterium 68-20]
MPFDAMVEVGGALGPSFEAQAVNLSEEGMSLRTAYLPEVGQPVMCRFEGGPGMSVVAAGEVLWKDDMGDGGEFGIRFTNLDGASAAALQQILGTSQDGQRQPDQGRKVRLHIEGLASPMRARIKDQMASGVTAYSELGFLQMGRPLELEDAATGNRRPAMIDRVEVELGEGSRIPQLVVSLRYDDEDARAASLAPIEVPIDDPGEHTPHDPPQMEAASAHEDQHEDEVAVEPPMMAEAQAAIDEASRPEEAGIDEESNKLKSAFTRNAAKITPAITSLAKRAKVAAALLAARARRGNSTGNDVEIPVRRTTAPAPGGGLHTSGRKVVRGSVADERTAEAVTAPKPRLEITKKRAAIAASIGIATVLVFIALRKPAPAPQLASAPPADPVAAAAPSAPDPMALPAAPVPPPADPLAAAAAAMGNGGPTPIAARPGKPTPFTNGPVGSHPTIIKIKMDGPVEGILGATQPTGFTVVTPNRKVLAPAGSLASKDTRLEGVHITNDTDGAELTVSFKDGVPNYIVRARGETLELVLAKAGGTSKAAASTKKKATPTTTTTSAKNKKQQQR